MSTRDHALRLDAADPLSRWRDEFVVPDEAVVYLDGNSLGMMPRRTVERMERLMRDEWAAGLIGRGTTGRHAAASAIAWHR
jgi:kynureninase